jgi:hypothetical protein
MKKKILALHRKTGKKYYMLTNSAICTTNAHDQTRLVIYCQEHDQEQDDQMFVREYIEFYEKFEIKKFDE